MSFEPINCKGCILGSSSVGKSCIAIRYINNNFENDVPSTLNALYYKKIIETDRGLVQLNLWDTAGQEKYRALGKHFYKDAFIICLIYDLTNRKTFEDIKNIWYPDLLKYGEEFTVIAIIGNKLDLCEENTTDVEAENYAKEIGAKFKLVSAKTGVGVDDIFIELVKAYVEPRFSIKLKILMKGKEAHLDAKKFKKNKKKIVVKYLIYL